MKHCGTWGFLLLFLCIGSGAPAAAQDVEQKTIVTGDEMEIAAKGRRIIFSGHAKVTRGKNILTADRIMQDKASNRVDASGRIRFKTFTQQDEPVWGAARNATYEPDAGTGVLWDGPASITYAARESTAPLKLIAQRIAFDEKAQQVTALGDVQILTSSACAYGPNALLRQDTKTLVMKRDGTQPRMVYTDPARPGRFSADTITAYVDQKRVIFEGDARGTVQVKDED